MATESAFQEQTAIFRTLVRAHGSSFGRRQENFTVASIAATLLNPVRAGGERDVPSPCPHTTRVSTNSVCGEETCIERNLFRGNGTSNKWFFTDKTFRFANETVGRVPLLGIGCPWPASTTIHDSKQCSSGATYASPHAHCLTWVGPRADGQRLPPRQAVAHDRYIPKCTRKDRETVWC